MDTPQTRRSFYYLFRISSQDTVWIHPRHDSHSTTHSDSSNQIQTRYASDTAAILFLIQIQLSTLSSDTLQTQKSFCHLSGSQLQYGYTPNTEVILLLIQISTSDTVAILPLIQNLSPAHSCSIHRFLFVTHSEYRYTPYTEIVLIFIQESNTVTSRICSRHGRRSLAHTNPVSRYNSDMFQIWIPF